MTPEQEREIRTAYQLSRDPYIGLLLAALDETRADLAAERAYRDADVQRLVQANDKLHSDLAARDAMGHGFMALLADVAQLLDGWHQDGTAWTEWDESVRQRVTNAMCATHPGLSSRVEHCCGLRGYNPMKGDTCPACENAQLRADLAARDARLARFSKLFPATALAVLDAEAADTKEGA